MWRAVGTAERIARSRALGVTGRAHAAGLVLIALEATASQRRGPGLADHQGGSVTHCIRLASLACGARGIRDRAELQRAAVVTLIASAARRGHALGANIVALDAAHVARRAVARAQAWVGKAAGGACAGRSAADGVAGARDAADLPLVTLRALPHFRRSWHALISAFGVGVQVQSLGQSLSVVQMGVQQLSFGGAEPFGLQPPQSTPSSAAPSAPGEGARAQRRDWLTGPGYHRAR